MNTATLSLNVPDESSQRSARSTAGHYRNHDALSRSASVMALVLRSASLALHGTHHDGEEAFMDASRRMKQLAADGSPQKRMKTLLMSIKALHLYYHPLLPAAVSMSLNHYIGVLDSALRQPLSYP